TSLLTPASLAAMRSQPGPGGTLTAEIDGYGISLCLRRTAEGPHVVEHGGGLTGQHSGVLFVAERGFPVTVLPNFESGGQLKVALCYDDWALQQFAGLRNPPAVPTRVSPARLAEYEGTYVARMLEAPDEWGEIEVSLQTSDGALRLQFEVAGQTLDQ